MTEQASVIEGEVVREEYAIERRSVLSPDRAARLAECEEVIERGLLTFQEVGRALQAVRDEKLWVDHYGSFDAYLDQRWGFSLNHANTLIRSMDQARKLAEYASNNGNTSMETIPFPEVERHIRELALLKTDDLKWQAWTKAVEIGRAAGEETPTYHHVQTAVRLVKESLLPQPEKEAKPVKPKGRGTVTIGLPLENAARAMRGFYTYTELKCLALLITCREKG